MDSITEVFYHLNKMLIATKHNAGYFGDKYFQAIGSDWPKLRNKQF